MRVLLVGAVRKCLNGDDKFRPVWAGMAWVLDDFQKEYHQVSVIAHPHEGPQMALARLNHAIEVTSDLNQLGIENHVRKEKESKGKHTEEASTSGQDIE